MTRAFLFGQCALFLQKGRGGWVVFPSCRAGKSLAHLPNGAFLALTHPDVLDFLSYPRTHTSLSFLSMLLGFLTFWVR